MQRLMPLLMLLLFTSLSVAQPTPEPKVSIGAIEPGKETVLTLTLNIPDGYHAQSDKPLSENLIPFEVTIETGAGISVGTIQYPEPQIKDYPLLGKTSVFGGEVVVRVPLKIDEATDPTQLSLSATVTYQICNDAGTCFAPQTKSVDVLKPGGSESTPASSAIQRVGLFGYSFDLTSIWVVLPIGMVVGLLFNVMPCVLPVLPLKAMGFYEASQHNRGKSLAFGAAFSAGLVSVFVGLAIFVILSKSLLGTHFQWGQWFAYAPFVWGMTLLLLVLGISMLGAFTIRVPDALYGLSFRHDTLTGNFLWGILTAFLSTPCTAPMFAGLVTWAVGQPVWNGFTAMTSVGVGMALPYALLSAFPQAARSFPRTGPASELVKQAMAFPLIGTAAWLIGPRLVGDPQHWWLVVIVAIWGGAFVLVRSAQILKSSTGLLITSLISVLIVSGTIWTALQFNGGFGTSKSTVASDRLSLNDWNAYSDDILAQALSTNRPVIVKFTASWCANCQVIEATVFRDAATLSALREREAILIKADLTRSEAPGWAKLNALGFTGIPLTAIYLPGKQDKPILLDSLYTSRDILAAIPEVAR